jgi:hypothetical protein
MRQGHTSHNKMATHHERGFFHLSHEVVGALLAVRPSVLTGKKTWIVNLTCGNRPKAVEGYERKTREILSPSKGLKKRVEESGTLPL